MIDLSVIICCYNGKERLRPTIEHLALQKTTLQWEFVLVDNASTDGSADYVESQWWELCPNVPLHVVLERQPGLVYARIAGVNVAQGKYIIFCDDDNWFREDYLQTAYDLMEQMPNVGVIGGQSVLAPGIKTPDWWEEQQRNYAVGKQLPQTGIANERGFVYGAGMVTRAELAHLIFNDAYPFLLTGRKGDMCLSGEDWEYCTRMRMMGYDIYYSEDLFFWHDVDSKRLTSEYLAELLKSFDNGSIIQEKYNYAIQFANISRLAKLKCLLIRLMNVTVKENKERKQQLLDYHLFICGLNRKQDDEFYIIKEFVKYAQQFKATK